VTTNISQVDNRNDGLRPRKTKADLREEADALLSDVAGLVARRVSFIDTLSLWIPKKVADEPVSVSGLLQELIDSGYALSTSKLNKPPKDRKHIPTGMQQKITIQKPSDDGLEYLEQRLQGQYLISRLDVALDLCTRSYLDAEVVSDFFDAHLVMLYRRGGHIARVCKTKYYASSWKRNNLVVYASKPSKETGTPCCHIERRSTQPAAVRQLFGKDGSDHVSLTEVLALDHRAFWSSRLVLEQPHLEAVAMRWNGNSYQKKSDRRDRLLAALLGRDTQTEFYNYSMQALLDSLKPEHRRALRHRMDNSVFLPPEPVPAIININMFTTGTPTTMPTAMPTPKPIKPVTLVIIGAGSGNQRNTLPHIAVVGVFATAAQAMDAYAGGDWPYMGGKAYIYDAVDGRAYCPDS
jgi:hypothetical protein